MWPNNLQPELYNKFVFTIKEIKKSSALFIWDIYSFQSNQNIITNRGSYISAHVLLNLLKELGKR